MDENETPKSFIFIEFVDVGSVNMNRIQYENVTPMQILALSEYFQLVGKTKLVQEMAVREEQMQQQRLSVPENKIVIAKR